MYEINNLTFRYMLSDRYSLEQVSLKIKKGKITLIAGPSGSGKTTLLRHLKKELLPKGKRSGKVLNEGQEIVVKCFLLLNFDRAIILGKIF